jgi:hypothetical protein
MEENYNRIIAVFIIITGIVISLFNVNDYTFEMLKILGIILFSIIWTFYVSVGSILTNKYFIRDCPKWCEKNKDHPWFKMSVLNQFLDILISISLVIINFYFITALFKITFNQKDSNKVGSGFYNRLLNLYMLLKTGSSKKCVERNIFECNNAFVCKYTRNKLESRCNVNPTWYYRFEEQISKNITILNAFLTILFQTNLKNKLEYFIKENMKNSNYLSVPNQMC